MPETLKAPMLRAMATLAPTTWNEEARTIDVIASTGAAVRRFDWWTGEEFDEELAITPEAIRLDRLNSRAPVCDTHNTSELEDQIGVVEKAWIEGGNLMATLRMSGRPDVAGIVQDIKDGVICNISIGYRVHTYEKQGAPAGQVPTYRAIDWEPYEVSFVPVPADAGAQARSEDQKLYPVEVRDTAAEPPAAPGGDTQEDSNMPETNHQGEQQQIAQAEQQAPAVNVEEIRNAERARVTEIMTATRAAKLPETFADGLIKAGTSIDQARAAILNEMAKREPQISVRVERDETDSRRSAMEAALQLRADPRAKIAPQLVEAARNYRGMSLLDMAREAAEAAGINTRGMSRGEVAAAGLGLTRDGGMSTSDFPLVLAAVANKSLRQGYEAAPQTFKAFTRMATAADFKQIHRVALGEAPRLLKVLEGGEITRGTVGEAEEKYSLATYARIVNLSRQVIVNDDLDAFTRLPMMFGRAAADLESDTVWGIITANAAMADGTALFHADHKNLAAANAAITVDSLGIARAALRTQKGIDGQQILNLQPRYLIVPAAKETVAQQYVTSTQVVYTKGGDVNPFAGSLEVVAEPRLDANSTTAWYLAADPMQIDTIEYAYLDGQEGVYLETRQGWEVDGLEIKARLDFGAAAIDFRGLFKNLGV